MRVSWRGGGRKPTQLKLTSETFAFKAAALRLYETRDMRVVIRTLWPGIDPDSTTYQSKARVIRRWKSKKVDILGMASKTKTAQLKRYRHAGTAKTLSDDEEMDILEWIIGLRSQGIPVSAKMLQQEALEIASLYDMPRFAFAASPTWMGTFLSRYRGRQNRRRAG
ncbi:hypothetical protein DVH05_006852 [Phytophthora capsici]|nr:hypothetical protein DVH05_006852 [Phytophthora capsici]